MNILENKCLKTNIIGGIISIITNLIFLLIISIILTYTKLEETTIPILTILAVLLSSLLAAFISVKKIKKNGLINGLIIGGIGVLFLYVIGSIINLDWNISNRFLIIIIVGISGGAIGGVVGANCK